MVYHVEQSPVFIFVSNLNCPGCGGLIQHISPHIRSIDCIYCGSWLRLGNGGWRQGTAQSQPLVAPAFLGLGKSGVLPSQESARIVGRLRYGYGLGEWDEWWLETASGEGFWLEEDDGAYYLHTDQVIASANLHIPSIEVGKTLSLDHGIELYVTEKYTARIVGREGLLPVVAGAGEKVTCVDGTCRGREYSLEILNGEAELSLSVEVDIDSMAWKDEIY